LSVALQWIGAILCLAAFALSQLTLWSVASYRYLTFNLVGGTMLSVSAAITHQWGFVLLEAVWALVAGWSITVHLHGDGPPNPKA
jgi:hypothetical protein